MDATISITFNVSPSEEETIKLRMAENGFDDISSYLKVVALKTQAFNLTPAGATSKEEETVEVGFNITETQHVTLEEKVKESECSTLEDYLQYVALHAVVTAVVEVRSTGNFDDMLKRIAAAKQK